jgi:hypothetical protein
MKRDSIRVAPVSALVWLACLILLGFVAPAKGGESNGQAAGFDLENFIAGGLKPMLQDVAGLFSLPQVMTQPQPESAATSGREISSMGERSAAVPWPAFGRVPPASLTREHGVQALRFDFAVLPTLRLSDGSAVTPGLDFHAWHQVRQDLVNHRTTLAGKNLVNFRMSIRPVRSNVEFSASLANMLDDDIYLNLSDLNSGLATRNAFVAPRTFHLGVRVGIR